MSSWLVYTTDTGNVVRLVTGPRVPADRPGLAHVLVSDELARQVRLARTNHWRIEDGVPVKKELLPLTYDRPTFLADGNDHVVVAHAAGVPVQLWVGGIVQETIDQLHVTSSMPRQVLVKVAPGDPRYYSDPTLADGTPGAPLVLTAEEPE